MNVRISFKKHYFPIVHETNHPSCLNQYIFTFVLIVHQTKLLSFVKLNILFLFGQYF